MPVAQPRLYDREARFEVGNSRRWVKRAKVLHWKRVAWRRVRAAAYRLWSLADDAGCWLAHDDLRF